MKNSTMIGVGITMEGIWQNYVVYDLTLQMAWETEPLNIDNWILQYATQRYGSLNSNTAETWSLLRNSVYNVTRFGGVTKNMMVLRPNTNLFSNGFMGTNLNR
eukprot:UN00085